MRPILRAGLGFAVWSGLAWSWVPNLHHAVWSQAMLLLAALVLAPLALALADGEPGKDEGWTSGLLSWVQLPAALLLGWSGLLPAGPLAALAAAPWVGFCGWAAWRGFQRARHEGGRRAAGEGLFFDAALMYLGIGGAWVLADRAGVRPLGFDPAIVTLTAVHFHFAGLWLPMAAAMAASRFPDSRLAWRASVGAVLGVPAVAAGITATQLGWGAAFECAAGVGLALSGTAVAVLHLRLGWDGDGSRLVRGLFLVAGLSLFYGMLLAGMYAAREYWRPWPWLDLPWMRALHGTVNAFGFGLGGALAWTLDRLEARRLISGRAAG